MTFRVANNQIHIGWPEMRVFIVGLFSFIIALAGAVWGVRAGYDDFLKDKQETNARLARIERQLAGKNTTDSLQSVNIQQLITGQKNQVRQFDSLGNIISSRYLTQSKPHGPRFYTEKWVNGHLQLTEVKQD